MTTNPPTETWKCGYCGQSGDNRGFMEKHKCPPTEPREKVSEEAWLYHPGLVNSESGYTGRYRPAGIDKLTGVPLIELEQVIKKENL